MAVTENLQAIGAWSLKLRTDTPQQIIDALDYFSHVAITEAPEDIRVTGDAVLDSARYVGVLRGRTDSNDGVELSGGGMAVWLGDEDDKGLVYETPRTFSGASFTAAVTELLRESSARPGTLHSVTGTYSGSHVYETPRKALNYLCGTMDAEWRINGNGTVDAGQVDDLYPLAPRAGIIARARGTSSHVVALPGEAKLAGDVEDWTSDVVLLASGTEAATAIGRASIAANPYRDLYGNPVKMVRLVSESTTSSTNADTRAQLQLNRFTKPRTAVTLNSTTHDVQGHLAVGEHAYVYDPDAGLYDNNTELYWQGEVLHPVVLRVTSLTWPVESGRGVYLRRPDGTWLDLTHYVTYESGQTNVTVGGYNRSLVSNGSEPVTTRTPTVQPNTSIPAAPSWELPLSTATYQSEVTGTTRAQVRLNWTRPLNTDGSAIVDGDYYEVRYRTTSQAVLAATHAQMALYSHDELNTHDDPLPFVTSGWAYLRASFDVTEYVLSELDAGTPYEFQVRAIDNGSPANAGDWSLSVIAQTALDSQAPETPAVPFVAGNPLSVMVQHHLGAASGGNFTLARDLHHLEVHAEYTPHYEPVPAARQDGGTLIGTLAAAAGDMASGVPVTGSFQIAETGPRYIKVVAVDNAGNRSGASEAAQVSVLLIDDQYITNLTASKITAGTLSATIVNGGRITTNDTGVGVRVGMDAMGFYGIDAVGDPFFDVSESGVQIRGTVQTGKAGQTRIIMDAASQALLFYPGSSRQRYIMRSFTGFDPGDPANAPGLNLYGVNELNEREGAFMSLWEDGFSTRLVNPNAEGKGGHTGGYVSAGRSALVVGHEDAADPARGWTGQFNVDQFQIRSRQSNGNGGYLWGGGTWLNLQVRDTGTQDRCHINLGIDSIHIQPGGTYPNRGWFDIRHAPNSESSPQLRMITGFGNGVLLKAWNGSAELRRWDDAVWASIVADAFVPMSDRNLKREIRPAEPGGLERVRKLKPSKYKRKGKDTPCAPHVVERVLQDDEEIDGTVHPAGSVVQEEVPAQQPAPAVEELGLIAQEVPEDLQVKTSDGLGIDLYGLVTTLVQAVQEQADVNDAQAERIATLEAQVQALIAAAGIKDPTAKTTKTRGKP